MGKRCSSSLIVLAPIFVIIVITVSRHLVPAKVKFELGLPSSYTHPLINVELHPKQVYATSFAQYTSSICKDKPCTNLLSKSSSELYRECTKNNPVKKNHYRCSFRDGRGIDPIALVSFPGSGNTWTRGLLERASGICTGAVYCDAALRRSGFIGENLRDGNVLVIKTHSKLYHWKGMKIKKHVQRNPPYGSAILLIRNPFDAIVAERNRQETDDHTGLIRNTKFENSSDWNDFVSKYGDRWKVTILNWLGSAHKFNISLLLVRYEDLKEEQVEQVARMLDFLQQDYNRTELAARLEVGFDEFHRKQTAKDHYEHYTEEQKTTLRTIITDTVDELQGLGIDTHELRLEEYLE